MSAEALLKDTMSTTDEGASHHASESPQGQGKLAVAKARRKLAKHVYYPEEAISAGMEGEVRLLVTLDGDGHIKDVEIADSSGYPILDRAAIRAAYAMGSLPGVDRRELILPVTFRLQP